MPQVDPRIQNGCIIIPFVPPTLNTEDVENTSLAALIAVTIQHDKNISAEERLMEIIEATGEVEVLEGDDVMASLGIEELDTQTGVIPPEAANDNDLISLI